jgi:NAD(P)-dependent dehydrogenase (short-subunit alcohol dehydrogenase family)
MGKQSSLEALDFSDLLHTFDVNALGPLRATRALLGRLREAPMKKIAQISSAMGSIDDNTSGGAYGYRMSKAALNMANKSMSLDLAADGFTCLVLNPGWVQTDMGGKNAPTPVRESAAGLIKVIDGATAKDSARFLNFDGKEYAW